MRVPLGLTTYLWAFGTYTPQPNPAPITPTPGLRALTRTPLAVSPSIPELQVCIRSCRCVGRGYKGGRGVVGQGGGQFDDKGTQHVTRASGVYVRPHQGVRGCQALLVPTSMPICM